MSNFESKDNFDVSQVFLALPPVLQFDPAKYAAELATFDLTEAQKQELLSTLWSIMCSFVELGFTVNVCATSPDDTSPIPVETELV